MKNFCRHQFYPSYFVDNAFFTIVILVSGDFGFSSEHNKPCLIYTTFYNKIYIYHNITLSSIAPSNLIDFLKEQVRLMNLMKYRYMLL